MKKTIVSIAELAERSERLADLRARREKAELEAPVVEPELAVPLVLVCAECGNDFRPTHGHQTICSDECRKARGQRSTKRWRKKHPEAASQARRKKMEHSNFDHDVYLYAYRIGKDSQAAVFCASYRDVLRRELEQSLRTVELILQRGTPVSTIYPQRPLFADELDILDFYQQRAVVEARAVRERARQKRSRTSVRGHSERG